MLMQVMLFKCFDFFQLFLHTLYLFVEMRKKKRAWTLNIFLIKLQIVCRIYISALNLLIYKLRFKSID